MDKENNSLTPATLTGMDALCRNSIELIQYARKDDIALTSSQLESGKFPIVISAYYT